MRNVIHIVTTASWKPVNGYYPALHHLPQTVVLLGLRWLARATGRPELDPVVGHRFTAAGYIACRSVEAVYGTATILFVFLVGRRLFSPGVGLLAAAFLSGAPWHIQISSNFKPDGLLVLMMVVAVWWSLLALEKPTAWRFALAGLAVGLAVATKYNGVAVAIPVAFAAFASRRRTGWRRAVVYCGLAAVVSVLVFFALNPYAALTPQLYIGDFGRTLQHYRQKGVSRGGGSHLLQIWRALAAIPSRYFHGRLVGTIAIGGLLGLAADVGMSSRGSLQRQQRGLVLLTVIGYVAFYAIATSNPFEQAWVPLLPFTSLAAAWGTLGIVRWLRDFTVPPWRTVASSFAVGAIAVWAAIGGFRFVYFVVTPYTVDVGIYWAMRKVNDFDGRYVVVDRMPQSGIPHRGGTLLLPLLVDLSDGKPDTVCDRSDAEVYIRDRKSPEARRGLATRLVQRRTRKPTQVDPAVFEAWGPSVVVLEHPWKRGTKSGSLWLLDRGVHGSSRVYGAAMPEGFADELISVDLWFQNPSGRFTPSIRVASGDETGPCGYVRAGIGQMHVRCARIIAGSDLRITLSTPEKGTPPRIAANLRDWSAPRVGAMPQRH